MVRIPWVEFSWSALTSGKTRKVLCQDSCYIRVRDQDWGSGPPILHPHLTAGVYIANLTTHLFRWNSTCHLFPAFLNFAQKNNPKSSLFFFSIHSTKVDHPWCLIKNSFVNMCVPSFPKWIIRAMAIHLVLLSFHFGQKRISQFHSGKRRVKKNETKTLLDTQTSHPKLLLESEKSTKYATHLGQIWSIFPPFLSTKCVFVPVAKVYNFYIQLWAKFIFTYRVC